MGQGDERLHDWVSEIRSAADIESARKIPAATGAVVLGKRISDVAYVLVVEFPLVMHLRYRIMH